MKRVSLKAIKASSYITQNGGDASVIIQEGGERREERKLEGGKLECFQGLGTMGRHIHHMYDQFVLIIFEAYILMSSAFY